MPCANDSELRTEATKLINAFSLFGDKNKEIYNPDSFGEMFDLIKSISFYCTQVGWQELINRLHARIVQKFTSPDKYTADLWYKGGAYVNFKSLLGWISQHEVSLPQKRLAFLGRMALLQE